MISRTVLACAALALSVLLVAGQPSAQAADEDVVAKMEASRIERILEDFGLEYEELDNGVYTFRIEGLKVALFNKGETMQLYAGFSGRKVTLSRINEWNKGKRFSRAYLDDDNDPVIEADIELTGGVTERNVKEWMKTFAVSLTTFKKHIE